MEIDSHNLPQHIAIIMDGNGRWALSRKFSRVQGHVAGVKRVEEVVDAAQEMGVKVLTLYTFSTENWNRPDEEITTLMNMLNVVLRQKVKKLKKNNIRFQTIGRKDRVPKSVQETIDYVINETKDNTGIIMNLAFNYGARLEIVDAVKFIAGKVAKQEIAVDKINEQLIDENLYTHNLPDPDLLIRTSGEKRISNFLLWQLSYAEFYFTDKYWPDFTVEEFQNAIIDYQSRRRRFGKTQQQLT